MIAFKWHGNKSRICLTDNFEDNVEAWKIISIFSYLKFKLH